MIDWCHFPKSDAPTALTRAVVETFEHASPRIDSSSHQLPSNEVLSELTNGLAAIGFRVETGKRASQKITVPVLYGPNGLVQKSFEADAYHPGEGYVVEVEAGRAVANNQFLKDLFQACVMRDVLFLAIAVRRLYEGGGRSSRDFEQVVNFFDTLYASDRIRLPLRQLVVIGY